MVAEMSALPRAAALLTSRGSRWLPFRALPYTNLRCYLCDSQKENLHTTSLLAGIPYSLVSLGLQERDITMNLECERLYQYEIPVLAKVLPDGSEWAVDTLRKPIVTMNRLEQCLIEHRVVPHEPYSILPFTG